MKKKIDLTKGNILNKILKVAVPTVLTSLAQMAYNLTDMFWVGKVDTLGQVSKEAIAAVGTAGYYVWLGFGLILIAKTGISVNISQAAGKNDTEDINYYSNNGLFIMFILALIYSVVGFVFSSSFIGIFNIENSSVVNYANEYLRIISLFGISYFMVNAFNSIYDGLGKTVSTFLIMMVGLSLNMFLDPVFILVFKLGVKGAAIATVLSQATTLFIYIIIYISKFKPAVINFKKYFSFIKQKIILKIGIPTGIHSLIFTTIAMIIGVIVATFGDEVIATQRIGSQIEAFAWMIASGFQVALATFVGQNFGAKKYKRIEKGYIITLCILVPYGLFVNSMLYFGAGDLFRIFIDDQETLLLGKTYLKILSFSQIFMILELATAGAFNGVGKTYIPSIIGITGNALRIPLALLLSARIGVNGIWWAVSLSSVLKGLIIVLIFIFLLISYRKNYIYHRVDKIKAV